MTDNIILPSSDLGGDTVALDDIGGIKFPRSKITIGADNTNDGDVAATNPLPVGANTVKDGSGTVYAPLVDTDGHLQVDVLSAASTAVTNAGTFVVQINGDALTALQLIDDAVYTDATGTPSKGVAVMGTDGTNPQIISVDTSGHPQVDVLSSALPSGAATAANQSTANTALSAIQTAVETIDNAVSGSEIQVDIVADGADLLTNTTFNAAFGTAGTPDTQVISVQGIASMTPLLVDATGQGDVPITLDGEAVSITGTVTVDLGANNDVTINGSSVVYTDDGDWTATSSQHMLVGGVYQSTPGTITDGDVGPFRVNQNGAVHVSIQEGGGSGGTSATDDAAFTAGSGSGTPAMGFFSTDLVDSGDVGVLAMDAARRLMVSIEADNAIGSVTQYTEDDEVNANPVGNAILAERDDALGGLTPAEGDWTHLFANANGALWVKPDGVVSIDDNSGSITVDNAGTFAVQVDGDALTALQLIDDAVYTDDADWTDGTSKHLLTGGLYQSTPQSITDGDVGPFQVTANGYLITSVNGTVTVDGSGVTQPISASSLPLPSGASTAANQSTANTALSAIQTAVEIMDDWDETNRAAVNLIASQTGIAGGTGVDAGNVPRVTLATDVALPAGTNAIGKLAANSGVDIGDVDVTSISAGSNLIGDVGIQGRTTGGLSIYYDNDLDETAVAVKASAGTLYAIHAINLTAAPLYLQLFNVAQGSVTVGTTTPTVQFVIPANADSDGAGFTLAVPQGIAFSTAITAAATTGSETAGAPGANECHVNLFYK